MCLDNFTCYVYVFGTLRFLKTQSIFHFATNLEILHCRILFRNIATTKRNFTDRVNIFLSLLLLPNGLLQLKKVFVASQFLRIKEIKFK